MKWDDDLLMEAIDIRGCNVQMALYAAKLGTGSTLFQRQIKVDTIKKYLLSVASFIALVGNHPRDPRKRSPTDKEFCPELQAVLRELERWEKVPNRREPYTLAMQEFLERELHRICPGDNSLLAAIVDWGVAGLFTGFRLSEWAQPTRGSVERDVFGDTKAFCLPDLSFSRHDRTRLSLGDVLAGKYDEVAYIQLRWRTQKNGDNGQCRLFSRNPENPLARSLVSSMLRIVRRFSQLCGPGAVTTPLAVYQRPDGSVALITSIEIEATLRTAAQHVYTLDPIANRSELQQWSSHSYRVGACVILHAMGYSPTQIKFLLRWRSEAVMTYLRNLPCLAQQHARTIDEAGAMPSLF